MSPLVSLAAFVMIAQVSSPALSQALRSVEDGAAAGAFTPDVGAAAVQAVSRRAGSMTPDELGRHLQVALRGKGHQALAPHLGRLLASDGPSLQPALRAAGELDVEHRAAMIAALGAKATRSSISFATSNEDEKVARGAITVLVVASPPAAVLELLRGLIRDELFTRADWALQVIGDRPPSTELLTVVLEVERELPPALAAPLARTLAAFIDRRPALAVAVVEALQARPSPALLGAAVAMPPDLWEVAISGALFVITELSPDLANLQGRELDLFIAAVGAAADLRAAELLPLLPELCRATSPVSVRLAALRALGEVGAKEASIIDQLLLYLPEPGPIGAAAFAGLRLRAGAKLPLRLPLWQDWRRRTPLVVMTPEEHAARLRGERRARYVARTSALHPE